MDFNQSADCPDRTQKVLRFNINGRNKFILTLFIKNKHCKEEGKVFGFS